MFSKMYFFKVKRNIKNIGDYGINSIILYNFV